MPWTTRGYSMVKLVHLNDAFSEFFELEASPEQGRSLQQTDTKKRKMEGAKN